MESYNELNEVDKLTEQIKLFRSDYEFYQNLVIILSLSLGVSIITIFILLYIFVFKPKRIRGSVIAS